MFRFRLIAIALLAATGVAQAQGPILIGVAGPMTGADAAFGAQEQHGVAQALADINKAGGLLGRKLAMDVQDDACDPRQAVSVANKLASDGVALVVGHFCSASSIPASKVYTEEGIIEISPASTNPAYTDNGAWDIFRVCGRDDQQGAVAGAYIAKHFRDQKIAILDDNSTYGLGLAEQTRKAMLKAGVKPAMFQAYVPGERDYSALVSRMKEAGITMVYVGGYYTEAGLILRQAASQGMKVTLMGGDALMSSDFWGITGAAGNGTLMTFPPDPRKLPSAAKVVAEFDANKIDPEGYVLYSYAAVQVWAEAVKKIGTLDPQKVAAEMKANKAGWSTVLGPIAFDHKGDVRGAHYVVYDWKNGKYSQL